MGKVYINGKAYDSLTGLKLDSPAKSDDSITLRTEGNTPDPKASPRIESPKQRRIPKQQRLAEAVAKEFEDEPKQSKTIETSSSQKTEEKSTTPFWISNFASGNDPIAIEPIQTDKSGLIGKVSDRSTPIHHDRKRMQRSQTLNRSFVKKPAGSSHVGIVHRTSAPVAKHPDIHRYAPASVRVIEDTIRPARAAQIDADKPFTPAITHKAASEIVSSAVQRQPIERISGSDLKEVLIKNQLDRPIDRKSRIVAEKNAGKFGVKRHFARTTLVTAGLAILVMGGYFAYVNMPSLSVRVAANKAGVDTEYPYTPNGYSIDGPVAYSPGMITIKYKSNGGAPGYSITGQNTDLSDSEIVDSVISSDTDSYETATVNGITIYEYNGDAAWVSNGVLYKLDGNNLLSNDQLSKIVQSV